MENGNYTYPAIITYLEDDDAEIFFPDFDQITCVGTQDMDEIITASQDMLSLAISDYMDCGKELPAPSKITDCKENSITVLVNIWLPYHRAQEKIQYVKKTLTIPVWLDLLSKERNVNYSALLVKALKEELGLMK